MLPKRKLIKKQYVAPETSLTEEGVNLETGDLIEQLKSGDPKIKADAISAIANIQSVAPDLQQQLFSPNTLLELVNVLTTGGTPSIIQTTLFAINNLCMHQAAQGQTASIVNKLFGVGLDKALMGLNSNDADLLKPILMLMGTIADYVPAQHRYLLKLMQSNLVINQGKYLQEKYSDLVMQFLIESNAKFNVQITPEQIAYIQMLQKIAEVDKLYKNRALASRLQCTMTNGKLKECIDLFCANLEEFVTDIDLEREYKANFSSQPIGEEDLEKGDEEEEEQQVEEMMEETNKKSKPKQENLNKQVESDSPYNIFIDALQGIQVMLEFVVEQLEDEAGFAEEEEQEDQMGEDNQQEEAEVVPFDRTIFLPAVEVSLNKIIKHLHKYVSLSFIEGQNIIELVLRLLLSLPSYFTTSKNEGNQMLQSTLVSLAEEILINQFKFEINHPHQIPQEVFIFNANTALQVILKYKLIINRNIYIELPYLKYGNQQATSNRVISVSSKWKNFWINLLEIYSQFYNPEKIGCVSEKENKDIGGTLKQLIVEIPEVQLEQWRGQAIDTVFDVYSNENFDKIFMEYGFVEILTQVLKVASGNSKLGTKNKKTSKFISAVVSDIQRFIAYKKKMIGF